MRMTMRVVFDAEVTAIPDMKKAVADIDSKAEITFHPTRETKKAKS